MKIKFFFVVIALAALTSFAHAQPSYNSGDFWVFKVVEKDFVRKEMAVMNGEEYLAVYDGSSFSFFWLDRSKNREVPLDTNGQEVYVLQDMLPGTGKDLLKFPLADKWDGNYMRPTSPRSTRMETGTAIVGTENISTAAGNCSAIKLSRTESARSIELKMTYYYCESKKVIAKYRMESFSRGSPGGTREIELINSGNRSPDIARRN
ncbi:hypothetical protein HYW53_01900 [Candidatus Giovannonibacteria bacterium]|nr:hypothetical protein [Candidatus Giovannonibacteria bacterium]